MADPFVGQVAIFGFPYAPQGWAFCQGQIMPISQNPALFSILATTYGGDGKVTFALPNLQGCAVNGAGQGPGLSNYSLGENGGAATVPLLASEMPSHSHAFTVSFDEGLEPSPQGNLLARAINAPMAKADVKAPAPAPTQAEADFYSPNPGSARTPLAPAAIGVAGEGQAHNNMQPYLALNFCIALQGTQPTRP